MMGGQMPHRRGMDCGYRQLAKSGFQRGATDRLGLDVEIRMIEYPLDRDLLDVDGAEEHLVLG